MNRLQEEYEEFPHPPPRKTEKPKPINCQISKITIGQWTHIGQYPDDLKAKFYFAKRRLMWEILDDIETRTQVDRLKRKIEIRWSDVLSFRATFNPCDETGTLEVELGKRPTFFMETNPKAKRHTQWKEMEDFTLDQSASTCRRHTLHFLSGDLQKILDKLVSGDSFWSELAKKRFPTQPHSLHFDIDYGNGNNNDGYGHCRTLNFNVNNDLLHHHIPQGHVPVEELNFNMENQFSGNDGIQMNSFVQDNHVIDTMSQLPAMQVTHHVALEELDFNMKNQFSGNDWSQMNSYVQDNQQIETVSQLPATQVTYPSSQLINWGTYLSGSHFNNDISNLYGYGHCQTLSFDVNSDLLHHHIPQESGHAPLEGFNFNMANQFRGKDGIQMNSFVQHNHQIDIMSQLPVPQVTYPSSLCFDIGNGNSNNNDINNLYGYGHYEPLSFDVNNDLLHHHIPQESGHAPLEGFNFNMANQFSGNDGSQMNSFVQHNHQTDNMSQLPVAQVTGPSSQTYISGSHFNHPLIQDEHQTRNTRELRGSQAYAQEPQTNPIRFQHTNVPPEYQIGPDLRNLIAQEEERQNMKMDGNFQTNSIYNYDQYFSSEPPDLL